MNDRDRIGSAADNDRWNLWEFSRNSGLPRGYFDRRRIDPDFVVLVVCLAALAVGLAVSV